MELSIETKLYRLWSSVKARVTKDPRYINKGMYEVWLNNSKSFITSQSFIFYTLSSKNDSI